MNHTEVEVFKDVALSVVGTWYNKSNSEVLVFSLLQAYNSTAGLLIKTDNESKTACYTLEVKGLEVAHLYIWNERLHYVKTYNILQLSADRLMIKAGNESPRIYIRKMNTDFVNSVLKQIE